MIPVEVKTGNYTTPKSWHVMQLISYCHLVSESFQKTVPYGILVYSDTKNRFKIPYTEEYHSLLLSTINQMYQYLRSSKVTRLHSDARKCAHCSLYKYCSETIDKDKDKIMKTSY